MRKIIFSIALGCASISFGQSVTPEVIATSGDYFIGSNASLSWTLGEIMTETYNGSTNQLTQGFQQPLSLTNSLVENESLFNISVYPNPVLAELTLEIPDNTDEIIIEIFDGTGKLVRQKSYTGNGPQVINFEGLANGLYIMSFKNTENEILETIKIQKTK